MEVIKVRPIGFVRVLSGDESVSELVIDKELVDGLDGIEEFSHLHVLYWMHKLETGSHVLKIRP